MARSRALTFTAALGAALLLVTGGATAAFADQLAIDGDGLAPVQWPNGGDANVVACTDQPVDFTVLIAARRNGGANVTFANGGTVTVSFASATNGMTAAISDATIELPATWVDLPTPSVGSDTIPAIVTLPPQANSGSGSVTFGFAGPRLGGGTVAGTSDVNVNWTTQQCGTPDVTAPVLTLPANITAEATSAAGAVVEFAATAEDDVDGAVPVTCVPASGSVFPLGSTTVSCSATDAAGNTAADSFTVTVQDTTAPTLSAMADIELEATAALTPVTWADPTATDAVDPNPVIACTPAAGSTFGVGTHTVTCTATDASGNVGSTSFQVTVTDTTPPAITWVGGPEDGASYVFGSVPAAGTCTAYDLVEGSVPCAVTGYATTVGTHTLTATAEDSRHNKAEETRSYTVEAWTLHGFFKPVDMNGVWNSVKGGSTVPLKFEVFAGGTELIDVDAIGARFQVQEVTCGTDIVVDDIEMTSTGKTSLRYDTADGQFIQNWQTPKKANACFTVMLTTADGSGIVANFKLK